jgi:molybdate transport system ATP-binding protein
VHSNFPCLPCIPWEAILYFTVMFLSLDHANIRYQGKVLAEGLSFFIDDHEQWALVGANNADGSILLDILASRYHLSSGTLRYHFDPEHSSAFEKSKLIGYVAAHYHFRSLSNTSSFYYQQRYNMTGEEDADTVGEFLYDIEQRSESQSSRLEWSFDRVVSRLQLESMIEKQLIFLSNGETRRVMIAAALIRNPKLLLLDHPLTGLDAATRMDFNNLLSEIIASGIHVVVSTSAEEIPVAITHVALMQDRKIISTRPISSFKLSDMPSIPSLFVDGAELRSLIKAHHEAYDVIVGMRDVNVNYGDSQILNGVNWEVKQGERWSLRGHNGAGKSTLLSLINGDNPQAYSNRIVLFDKPKGPGVSIWSLKKRIGYVSPELFRYFPTGHTCLDVIESGIHDTLGLFRKNDPSNKLLIVRWLKLLGIEEVIDQSFDQVPFGAQRLCLLARALVKNPVLLILDEPCEGLDIVQQRRFVHVIDELCKNSDVTLIYVSHYQDQIPACVTRSIELERGMVRE